MIAALAVVPSTSTSTYSLRKMGSEEGEVPLKAENPPGNVVEALVQAPIIAENIAPVVNPPVQVPIIAENTAPIDNTPKDGTQVAENITPIIAPIDSTAKEVPETAEIPQVKAEILDNAANSDSESCTTSEYTSSSSSSSESEDSSSSSSDNEQVSAFVRKKDEAEENHKVALDVIMSKNELSGDKITIAPITVAVEPSDKLEYLGTIFSILEKEVIIRSSDEDKEMRHMWDKDEIGKIVACNSGTIVCFENREILGTIFDTCGPVQAPYYIVRFNSADEISENAKVESRIYAVEKHKKIVVGKDIRDKGYDTSNKDDEECDTGEYSDDEEEREARRRRNLSHRSRTNDGEDRPLKQTRGGGYESRNPYAEQNKPTGNRTMYDGNHQRGGRGRGRGRNRGRGRGGARNNNPYHAGGGGYMGRNNHNNNMGNAYQHPANAPPQNYPPPPPGAYLGHHPHSHHAPPQQPHIAQQMMQARVQQAPNAAGYNHLPQHAGGYHAQPPPPPNNGPYHGGPPSGYHGGYGQPGLARGTGGYAQPPGYAPYQYVPVQQQSGAPGQLAPYPSMVWGGSHWNGSQYVPNTPGMPGYYAAPAVPQAQMQAMAGMRNMTVGENSNTNSNSGQYPAPPPPPPDMGVSGQANSMPHPPHPSSSRQPAQTDPFPPNDGR